MKLNPLSNRVVIKFEEAEEKTKTGIILTASAQEKPQVADVIAVGPGKVTDNGAVAPMTVKVGDKVIAASMPARQSSWTVSSTRCCPRTTFWQPLSNGRASLHHYSQV